MKKIIVSLLVFCFLQSQAQKDTSRMEFPVPPDSTALGVPEGKTVSKEIGAGGGTILSGDGRVELIFPAGALTETKTISIQPTTNNAPNGAGKAYWFEPSGTVFKKPVGILFHYSDEEAETCPADLMYLATQNKNGKWTLVDYEEFDTVSKTLKGTIHHFSGAANGYKLQLVAGKTLLRVEQSTSLTLWKYSQRFDFSVQPTFNYNQPLLWYVNGKEGGNERLGYVNGSVVTDINTRISTHEAIYDAPDYLPGKGPVTISVGIYTSTGSKKVYHRSNTVKCRIWVYDVYRVTVIHKQEFRIAMGNELTDSASFLTWVYPDHIVLNTFQNYPPFLTRSTRRGPCSLVIFTSGADGSLHLTDGYRDLLISNDYPPEVSFRFLSTFEKTICRFSWVCPRIPPTPEQNLLAIPIAPEINFIANGNTQRINVNDNGALYKLIVVPYGRSSH